MSLLARWGGWAALLAVWLSPALAAEGPDYVGGAFCGRCHAEQARLWAGSHHDLAMQPATPATVLGDFGNARFDYFGLTSRFVRRGDRFVVNTDGPDGKLADFDIKYTFGVYPLQQYLIEFPDGRLQALGIAWDSRPKPQGGQRWFHLYPKERIGHGDPLHWTGPAQNWNHMCADCHSTNLRKNYDPETRRFTTAWSDIDVSCEACHGPGSRHVAWAEGRAGNSADRGFDIRFRPRRERVWTLAADASIARPAQPADTAPEIDTCARCHARREQIQASPVHGKPLLDSFLPALLTEGLYHPDGQMQDEVYNYGSFLQSKMYRQGVACGDCHEPHSLKLRAPGNGVCAQCHRAGKYDAPSHHFHKAGSAGAECAACHMPTTTYMGVDPRHDHGFRIPRPDLSAETGVPNACNRCHAKEKPSWAAARLERWYGHKPRAGGDFAKVLSVARQGRASAEPDLARLAGDTAQAGIVRATALFELGPYLSGNSLPAVRQGLADPDPLVRLGAVEALGETEPGARLPLLYPLLEDSVRGVRAQAARALAPLAAQGLPMDQRAAIERGLEEYAATQKVNADRPDAWMNLGLLYTEWGRHEDAEAAYRTALKLQPGFVAAHVNLADLLRLQGRDGEGERLLREALKIDPRHAESHHALGLLLARDQRTAEALRHLERAAALNPGNPRFGYVHAVALKASGAVGKAVAVLEAQHRRHPEDRDILYALALFSRELGRREAASGYAERFAKLAPDDPRVDALRDAVR
jgi:tetratricopeptide (TPR) repeat protein